MSLSGTKTIFWIAMLLSGFNNMHCEISIDMQTDSDGQTDKTDTHFVHTRYTCRVTRNQNPI